uniref:Uncharacterized protein n=1 Tax=Anguilla anguilla TaxID=7936 RepID=A0A0E9UE00_ANGAN
MTIMIYCLIACLKAAAGETDIFIGPSSSLLKSNPFRCHRPCWCSSL